MTYRFGVFEFEVATSVLRKNGRIVALEPQPSRALGALLARADEVVSRDELKDAVWGPGTHVDFDRGLAYCLSEIRTALGDSGDNPRFIQTLPKRGYRLIAPVTKDAGVVASAAPASSFRFPVPVLVFTAVVMVMAAIVGWVATRGRPLEARRIVVAVSVFDNETGDPQFDRVVGGLSDLVVTRLAGMDARIAVVGNAAILRQPRNLRNLKAVAEGVAADYVLLGQLQRDEAGYRFITHVIRLSDQTHLKANRLQMPDGGVSGLEAAVVAEFDRAVRAHVLSEPAPAP